MYVAYLALRDGSYVKSLKESNQNIDYRKIHSDFLKGRMEKEFLYNHGMFSNNNKSINLNQVLNTIQKHEDIIWESVFSLKEEDADFLKMNPERWIETANDIMKKLPGLTGIPKINLESYAALHLTEGHPHFHIIFFEKDIKKSIRRDAEFSQTEIKI
jgi:hypothetical protein